MEVRTATVRDVDLTYDYKAGAGTPFLFLHGTGASAKTFSDVIQGVPAGRKIYNFDLRGHGRSAWSATGDYLIEDHVDDVRTILSAVTGQAFGKDIKAMAKLVA